MCCDRNEEVFAEHHNHPATANLGPNTQHVRIFVVVTPFYNSITGTKRTLVHKILPEVRPFSWDEPKLLAGQDGGAEGNQTPDLFIANEALYRLSYSPFLSLWSPSCGKFAAASKHLFPPTSIRVATRLVRPPLDEQRIATGKFCNEVIAPPLHSFYSAAAFTRLPNQNRIILALSRSATTLNHPRRNEPGVRPSFRRHTTLRCRASWNPQAYATSAMVSFGFSFNRISARSSCCLCTSA